MEISRLQSVVNSFELDDIKGFTSYSCHGSYQISCTVCAALHSYAPPYRVDGAEIGRGCSSPLLPSSKSPRRSLNLLLLLDHVLCVSVLFRYFYLFLETPTSSESVTTGAMSSTTGSSEAALHQRQNEPNSKEQIQKQRIVSHMNSDHRDSLSMFLVIYNKVPYTQAQTAQIEEIRLSGMTISTADYPDRAKSSRTNFFVPFEPALNGYEEARHKVVEMHKHCLKTLGQSDITIQEYRRPRGFSAFMFTVCLVTFIAFSRRSNFQPGSELYSRLLQYVPDFATFCYKIQPLVIGGMVIIHSIEAIHMSIYRLRPHNVAIGSRLWFLWVLNDFVEGFTALQRFDALVEEKRALKAQHKPNLRG